MTTFSWWTLFVKQPVWTKFVLCWWW